MSPPRSPERVYFLAGVAKYEGESLQNLESVPEELARMRSLLERLGFTDGAPSDLRGAEEISPLAMRKALSDWATQHDDGEERTVVIYCTGHGEVPDWAPSGWFLVDRDYLADPLGNRLDPADLLEQFARVHAATDVLLVLDACMSGQGAVDSLSKALKRWETLTENCNVQVIASARPVEEAGQLRFVSAFERALDHEPQGNEYIDLLRLIGEVNEELGGEQQSSVLATPQVGRCRVLPNPKHMPRRAPDWLAGDLAVWSAPARGVTEPNEPGWFFTGRDSALADLVTTLDEERSSGGPCLVVGSPGTGKTALLARLYLAGHEKHRPLLPLVAREGLLPPEQSVHAAVSFADQPLSLDRLSEELARQLGVPEASGDIEELVSALARKGEHVGIVLDDVHRCPEFSQLFELVLRPLARLRNVRLVCSADSAERLEGWAYRIIDLDEPQHADDRELRAYIRDRLLRTPGSPFAGDERRAEELADRTLPFCARNYAVAAECTKVLLRASTDLERAVARRAAVVTDSLLRRAIGTEDAHVLVKPLRIAPTEWLPRSVWSRVVSADPNISREYSGSEIEDVARSGRAFLERSTNEDGEPCWRLRTPLEPGGVSHRSTLATLYNAAFPDGSPRWDRVDPALARLLVRQAQRDSSDLRRLLEDTSFLTHVAPQPDLGPAAVESGMRDLVNLWFEVHRRALDPDRRAALTTILAAHRGLPASGPAPRIGPVELTWAVRYADDVHGATGLVTASGWAATSHDDGSMRLWSLASLSEPEQLSCLGPGEFAVRDMAMTSVGGDPVVAAVRWNGEVLVWWPKREKTTLLSSERGPDPKQIGLTSAGVVLGRQREVEVIDVDTQASRRRWRLQHLRLTAVRAIEDGGFVVGTADGAVVWRSADRVMMQRHDAAIAGLAVSSSGRVIAAHSEDGRISVRDAHTGRLVLDVASPGATRLAVSDDWLAVVHDDPSPRCVLHDLAATAPTIEVPMPEGPVAAAFLENHGDQGVLIAAKNGFARLTMGAATRDQVER
nr:AAA family ATPase [Saccharopolyspora hordei]